MNFFKKIEKKNYDKLKLKKDGLNQIILPLKAYFKKQNLEKIFDDFENGMADEVYDKKIEEL